MIPTIKDVAIMAGVSIGTVSNFLNGKAKTSQKNKIAIQAAILDLGYEPNEIARTLRTSNPKTIGLLIPSLSNATIVKMAMLIEDNLRAKGFDLILINHHNSAEDEKKFILYLSKRVSGIVFNPVFKDNVDYSYLKEIQDKNIPIVTFDNRIEELECDCVLVDNKTVTEKLISKLREQGHADIGILAGPTNVYPAKQRAEGYSNAIIKSGLELEKKKIVFCDFSRQMGEEKCKELLRGNPNITALIVGSYQMTLGAIGALKDLGKYSSICTIGYNAEDIEKLVTPNVCYVYQPIHQIAEFTSMLLLKRLEGNYEGFPTCISLEAQVKNLESMDYYRK